MTTNIELELLAALAELTRHRISVDVAEAWVLLHGRPPTSSEWPDLRRTLLTLEREGLIRSDIDLHVEVTETGRSLLEPRNSA